MAGYIGNKSSVVSSGAERKFKFTITETTTTLSNLAYTPNLVHVFHNGVRLVDGTDYTATNGTSIILTNAAEDGDEVVVISYASFQTSDTVSASLGGVFEGNVTVNGDLTVDTDALFVDSANNRVGIGTTAPDGPLTVQLADVAKTSWSMALEGFNTAQLSHTISDSTSVRRKLSAIEGFVGSNDVSNFQGGLIFKTTPAAGSPTERVRIDAIGNMGIGTSLPTTLLDIGPTDNADEGAQVKLRGAPNGTVDYNFDVYQSNLRFFTTDKGNNNNFAERMRIDSAGRVTMPYQPAFSARREAAGVGIQTSGVITWNVVQLNIGSHYNSSTGVFTAPVSGVYVFNFFGIVGNSGTGGTSNVTLQVNGVSIAAAHTNHDQAWDNASFSARVALAANDQVQVSITGSSNGSGLYVNGGGAGSYNTFSGHLIG